MTYYKYLMVMLFSLMFVSSVYAQACSFDVHCSDGNFCDETNQSGTIAQCTDVNTTGCNGLDISCSNDDDCLGLGSGFCAINRGVCTLGHSQTLGKPCQLDVDCQSSYCSRGICSPNPPHTCSSDNDCSDYYNTYSIICGSGVEYGQDDYCTNSYDLGGGQCDDAMDCLGICEVSTGVCVECYTDWDYDENNFCDLNHYSTCDNSFFYPDYAYIHNLTAGAITPKKQDGASCDNDVCCISNNCVNGTCLKGGAYPVPDYVTDFCENMTYSLSSNWFDEAASVTDIPNATFFAQFFGHNDSQFYVMRVWYSVVFVRQLTVFDRSLSGGVHSMASLFYDNSTGDICYFRQEGELILWHCIEDCISAGVANYSDQETAYVTNDFSCQDDEMGLTISDVWNYNADNHLGVLITRESDQRNIKKIDTFLMCSGANCYESAEICSYDGASWHKSPTYCEYDEVAGGDTDDYKWCYDDSWAGLTWSQKSFRNHISGTGVPCSSGIGAGGALIPPFDGAEFAIASCCFTDFDCPTGFCCDTSSSTCYPCGVTTNRTDLRIFPVDDYDWTICHNATTLIQAELEVIEDDGYSYPVKDNVQISFSVDTGYIAPSCNMLDPLCIVTLYAPSSGSSVTITAVSEATDNYQSSTAMLQLALDPNCHYVLIYVWDEQGVPLSGVRVCPDGLDCKWTSQDGAVVFNFVLWDQLGASPVEYATSFYKNGYTSGNLTIPIDVIVDVTLKKEGVDGFTGLDVEPRTDYTITENPPSSTSEVTGGVLRIMYSLGAWFLPWWWLFVLLIIFMGMIYHFIVHIPSKVARG